MSADDSDPSTMYHHYHHNNNNRHNHNTSFDSTSPPSSGLPLTSRSTLSSMRSPSPTTTHCCPNNPIVSSKRRSDDDDDVVDDDYHDKMAKDSSKCYFTSTSSIEFLQSSSLPVVMSLLLLYANSLVSLTAAAQRTTYKLPPDRFYDKPFLTSNMIYNRKVACGKINPGIFPSRTWTCSNIRVDGRKIAFGHYPLKQGYLNSHCFDTNGTDDMGGICLGLMKLVNETAKLWVASVTNATCDYTEDERVLLTVDLTDGGDDQTYVWRDLSSGSGWIETLHCLTLPENS